MKQWFCRAICFECDYGIKRNPFDTLFSWSIEPVFVFECDANTSAGQRYSDLDADGISPAAHRNAGIARFVKVVGPSRAGSESVLSFEVGEIVADMPLEFVDDRGVVGISHRIGLR